MWANGENKAEYPKAGLLEESRAMTTVSQTPKYPQGETPGKLQSRKHHTSLRSLPRELF